MLNVASHRSRQSSVRRLRSKLDLAYDFAIGLQKARTLATQLLVHHASSCCVSLSSFTRQSSIEGVGFADLDYYNTFQS